MHHSCFCQVKGAIVQQGNNYGGSPDAECDVGHIDLERGYGFVMDGAGHSNKEMGNEVRNLTAAFKPMYEKALKKTGGKFNTPEAAVGFFQEQLQGLVTEMNKTTKYSMINQADNANRPCFALSQIVKIEGKPYLLTVEIGDSAVAIKKENSNKLEFVSTLKGNFGSVGLSNESLPVAFQPIGSAKVRCNCTPLEKNDQVIICSDGVTEFVTKEEMNEIAANDNPMGKYDEIIGRRSGLPENNDIKDITNNALKNHNSDPLAAGQQDDITFIRFRV